MNYNILRGRRAFVTGATGMVGSWLTRSLVQLGADVTALVRDWVPHSHLLGDHGQLPNFVFGDLADYRVVERAIAEYEIEIVFHLGAQTIVQIANTSPLGTFEANIKGTWNVLEACRQSSTVKAIVIASSDKAYGEAAELPYTELTPLRGAHPYDVSKSCADLLANAYWNTYRLPLVITRCGNIFGPGDLNFSRIIPGTIRSVLLNERPVIRSDGSLVREYFYVRDAADAYLWVGQKLLEKGSGVAGEAFNFSNERPMTVLEITRLILEVMGRKDLEPVILGTAKGEITAQALSAKKAREQLNWKSMYPMEQGIRETVEALRPIVLGHSQ